MAKQRDKQTERWTDGWMEEGWKDRWDRASDGRTERQTTMDGAWDRKRLMEWWTGRNTDRQCWRNRQEDAWTGWWSVGWAERQTVKLNVRWTEMVHLSFCLSVYAPFHACVRPSVHLSLHVSLSTSLSFCKCPSVHPIACQIHLSIYVSARGTDRQEDGWTDWRMGTDRQRDRRNGGQFVFPSTLQSANPFIFLSILLSLWPSDCLSVHRPTSPTVRRTNWQTRRQKDGPTHRPKAVPTEAQLEVLNWQYYLKESPFSQLKGLTSTPQQAHLLHNKDILRNILKMTIIPAYVFLHIDLQRFFVCFFSSIELLQPEQMKSVEQFLFCRSLRKQAGLKLHP